MTMLPAVTKLGGAITELGTAGASALIAPIGYAALGGGAGFLISDFVGETIKTAANLTGRTALTAEVVTKSVAGVGLLGLGWRMTRLGPLGKIGFFAAGVGSVMSAVVDVVKFLFPIAEWGETFGTRIRGWLKLGEGVVEGANRMSRAEYERIVAEQKNPANRGSGQGVLIRL